MGYLFGSAVNDGLGIQIGGKGRGRRGDRERERDREIPHSEVLRGLLPRRRVDSGIL